MNEVRNDIKMMLKMVVVDMLKIMAAVIPWVIYLWGAYVFFIPEVYVNTFNMFLDHMGSAHAANLAIITTVLAVSIGAILIAVVNYHPMWTKGLKTKRRNKSQKEQVISADNLFPDQQ